MIVLPMSSPDAALPDLRGRTALVTGGARRIGRALCLALARAGADVAVNHHSSGDAAAETVDAIRALGRRAVSLRADLESPTEAEALPARAAEALGGLDVLVNSAARFDSAPVEEISATDWDRVMAVNLRAPFLLAREAAPLLRERQGCIVNIADLSAWQPWPSYAHHAVSKAGLVQLTRVLARALAPDVRVNAIAPGTVLPPEEFDESDVRRLRERIPLRRIGSADDVVRALLYLVAAEFVTGEVLVVDGGRLLC